MIPMFRTAAAAAAMLVLAGCASKQEITRWQGAKPSQVCLAENKEVRSGVVDALQKAFEQRGITVQLIPATYETKHMLVQPSVNREKVAQECQAIVFYTANWHWDLAMYMRFANVWITDPQMSRKLGQATYQAGAGPDKFIDASKKLNELVGQILISL